MVRCCEEVKIARKRTNIGSSDRKFDIHSPCCVSVQSGLSVSIRFMMTRVDPFHSENFAPEAQKRRLLERPIFAIIPATSPVKKRRLHCTQLCSPGSYKIRSQIAQSIRTYIIQSRFFGPQLYDFSDYIQFLVAKPVLGIAK